MVVATDLEGTITDGALWRGLGRYLSAHGPSWAYRAFFVARMPAWLLVKLSLFSDERFRERWLVDAPRLLQGLDIDRLRGVAEWIVEHEFWPKRRPRLLEEIEEHRRRGRRVVLVSGAYQPVLDSFAARIGAEAIGTPLHTEPVRAGLPINTGPAKVSRLVEALGGQPVEAAYGDTAADIPMLQISLRPVAVQPDIGLRQVAQARGWRIIDGHQ